MKIDTNDTVALIVDPDFGARILEVAARSRHTWVVATPVNTAATEQFWAASPKAPELNAGGGVTTFFQSGADRESWCISILGTLDDHHNEHACKLGYSVIEVYGIAITGRLRSAFAELGFSTLVTTTYGFCARKPEPVEEQ
jgi:hypothetical protein